MKSPQRTLRILGIRGVPAAHGGFETFAEELSQFLVDRGWRVIVYCQQDGSGPMTEDVWRGVERIHIPISMSGAKATIVFDWKATRDAARHDDLCLTLGYNTAVFCALLRIKGVPNIINMDGIEWRRAKWGPIAKTWFWMNDWMGCWLGNHLVADHPEIQSHLATRTSSDKITVIPYGATPVISAPLEPLERYGLVPGKYLTLIARPEPENSILEAVRGFSCRARGLTLVVLGKYSDEEWYHRAIQDAASDEVMFLGAIYDAGVVQALRLHSVAYVHGHQVGGTNPSLVEALGAGNPVIAHDNRFNRWVAADAARYFADGISFDRVLTQVLENPECLSAMRQASRERFTQAYSWPSVLGDYEAMLAKFLPDPRHDQESNPTIVAAAPISDR